MNGLSLVKYPWTSYRSGRWNCCNNGIWSGKNAIEAAQINPQDIELIIVATTSHSHAYPSAACQVQGLLNIDDAISFDLAAACTGFVYALSVADQFIRAGKVKKP